MKLWPSHFVEEGWKGRVKSERLTNEEFGRVRDNVVPTCVDVAVVNAGRILLCQRTIQPLKGQWWMIGGRMLPGESPTEAASRKLAQDTGITIAPGAFVFLGVSSTVFVVRNEPPQENGSHTVNLTYGVELSDEHLSNLRLDAHEYEVQAKWFAPVEVLAGVGKNQLHPYLDEVVYGVQAFTTKRGL
ncbi:MAG: hypothetical protein A2754_01780 [Candidatus Magasanikbacteria bacterium RIFCSPHIGHO2_01_FULL_47_8]|uniref:Nudix hydrolase domain-containing protein n=1 Tax=Candidatus Magasanikbacteria bacterium RIFCSPHIGHO2_01_FULL_47_8 TaxID=1798673 RepID=A0A1F6MC03_9BACT|nr:MAG: hypothetical protein A2754_01780 [Candidatus Magasanikbacteria bacterium RIFCSPHIGHO2_01_FULL_47_8]